jgi:hypothetical protein
LYVDDIFKLEQSASLWEQLEQQMEFTRHNIQPNQVNFESMLRRKSRLVQPKSSYTFNKQSFRTTIKPLRSNQTILKKISPRGRNGISIMPNRQASLNQLKITAGNQNIRQVAPIRLNLSAEQIDSYA